MSMLASSNEIKVGITRNGSPTFDVLHYGAIGDGKHVDTHVCVLSKLNPPKLQIHTSFKQISLLFSFGYMHM